MLALKLPSYHHCHNLQKMFSFSISGWDHLRRRNLWHWWKLWHKALRDTANVLPRLDNRWLMPALIFESYKNRACMVRMILHFWWPLRFWLKAGLPHPKLVFCANSDFVTSRLASRLLTHICNFCKYHSGIKIWYIIMRFAHMKM